MYYDLAGVEYDVEHPPGRSPVRRSYVLCSTPRSGSTLLSEALHATGRLGTPIEYFDGTDSMKALVERWGCRDLDCYFRCLHRWRTNRDGVLGAKLHWYQLQELTIALGGDPLRSDMATHRKVLARVFPAAQLVHVVRRDLERQAVSWAIAEVTGQWTDLGGKGTPPAVGYDFDAIADCHRRLEIAEAGWQALFHTAGVQPLTVTYEQLTHDYPGTVATVARHLGVDLQPQELPAPRLRRQSNEHSERMLARYRSDRRADGVRRLNASRRGMGLFGDAHLATMPADHVVADESIHIATTSEPP